MIRSRKAQYAIIIWILLLEVLEISASLMSETGYSSFFAVLGFNNIPATLSTAWDAVFVLSVLWLIYRLLRDVFQVSISYPSLSKREIIGLAILVLWVVSAATTMLQFAVLVSSTLAEPRLETATYYSPAYSTRNAEIFGWYSIDWGPDYYYEDFKTIKNMSVDGVLLSSSEYPFVSNPEVFEEAATVAQQQGLRVGIILFNPYDAGSQGAWSLPVKQDHFADFTANTTWIEKTYTTKLLSVVSNGSKLNATYYLYDDMNFWEAQNLTNAQLFINITNEITGGRALMIGYYPPKELVIPKLSIMNWDWYSAPEDLEDLGASLEVKPSNNTSLGQFIWLYDRTSINLTSLESAYDELLNADRIEIFAMRYGAPSWSDGASNSILEHPNLVEYLTMLNQRLEGIENSKGSLTLDNYETNSVSVVLSKSVFEDPFSAYESGQVSQYATDYAGSSYLTLENTSFDQEMIETRFCGNGSNGINGWFAYTVSLGCPILLDENSSILLLLRLSPSVDGSAWAYYRVDALTEQNLTYSLIFKFYDVPMNYVWVDNKSRAGYYLIGSALDWKFYQFNVDSLFYTAFSERPLCITSVQYAIGANSTDDVKAYFLSAKISPIPLQINELPVNGETVDLKLDGDQTIRLTGIIFNRLFVTLSPTPTQSIGTEWSVLKISRTESYEWNTGGFSDVTENTISFNASDNNDKLLLNGIEISPEPENQQPTTFELNPKETKVSFVVAESTNTYLLLLAFLLPVILALLYAPIRVTKHFHRRQLANLSNSPVQDTLYTQKRKSVSSPLT